MLAKWRQGRRDERASALLEAGIALLPFGATTKDRLARPLSYDGEYVTSYRWADGYVIQHRPDALQTYAGAELGHPVVVATDLIQRARDDVDLELGPLGRRGSDKRVEALLTAVRMAGERGVRVTLSLLAATEDVQIPDEQVAELSQALPGVRVSRSLSRGCAESKHLLASDVGRLWLPGDVTSLSNIRTPAGAVLPPAAEAGSLSGQGLGKRMDDLLLELAARELWLSLSADGGVGTRRMGEPRPWSEGEGEGEGEKVVTAHFHRAADETSLLNMLEVDFRGVHRLFKSGALPASPQLLSEVGLADHPLARLATHPMRQAGDPPTVSLDVLRSVLAVPLAVSVARRRPPDDDYFCGTPYLPKRYERPLTWWRVGTEWPPRALADLGLPGESLAQSIVELAQTPSTETPAPRDGMRKLTDSTGVPMRSKSEVLIAEMLHALGVTFSYEEPFYDLRGRIVARPDFTIRCADGSTVIWEHLGLLDQPGYASAWERKLEKYLVRGLVVGVDLVTTDELGGLDLHEVRAVARKVAARSRQH